VYEEGANNQDVYNNIRRISFNIIAVIDCHHSFRIGMKGMSD